MIGNSIGIAMIFSWVLWLFIVAVVTYTILWSFRHFGYQRSARTRSDASTQTDETSLSILEQRDKDADSSHFITGFEHDA